MSVHNSNPTKPILNKETGKFCYPRPMRLSGVFSTTPNTVSVSSITRSGNLATVTTAIAHGLKTGDFIIVSGANQVDYNGRVLVTVTSLTTFTYFVVSSAATPATGTIVIDKGGCIASGTGTLAGTEFGLNDYIYVPSLNQIRQVSSINTPESWMFSENFISNVSGAVLNKVPNGIYNSIGCRNVGAASGTFDEATITTTDPEVVFYDINSITPVCGDATGTTLLIVAQEIQSV